MGVLWDYFISMIKQILCVVHRAKANPQALGRKIFALIILAFLGGLLFFLQKPVVTYAQQITPIPGTPTVAPLTSIPTSDLDRRIYQLEAAQSQTINSLVAINDYNRFLFTVTGAIIALLVGIQGFATFSQLGRENKRDLAERAGVKQVSDILTVVQQTLESRLAAEEEARIRAKEAEEKLVEVAKKFERLDIFYKNFQSNIKKIRNELESDALQWASTVPRHGFKELEIANKVQGFADRFDRFKEDSEPIEEERGAFSSRVSYIRGIAAHYANQPEVSEKYFKHVVSYQQPEIGEDPLPYNRRIANAYYYLGLIEANFGHNQNALDYFESANKRDIQGSDFLTKVVTAEATAMAGDFEKADQILSEMEHKIHEIYQIGDSPTQTQLRLWSRATLIRANMTILKREKNWEAEVQRLLHPVRERDSTYYYATATLAQSYHSQRNHETAKQLFQEIHDTIVALADINKIREVRSKILLLMFAGMSSKYIGQEKQSAEYLDQAIDYCNDLPKIDSEACTVFSPLSKRNENVSNIYQHIELIRRGAILLEVSTLQN